MQVSYLSALEAKLRLETRTGMGISGFPEGFPRESCGDGTWELISRCSRGDGNTRCRTPVPRGWNKILWDFHGNVDLCKFYGSPEATETYFQTGEGRLL